MSEYEDKQFMVDIPEPITRTESRIGFSRRTTMQDLGLKKSLLSTSRGGIFSDQLNELSTKIYATQ